MPTYSVPIVLPKDVDRWRKRWTSAPTSNASIADNGSLSRTAEVQARNENEAAREAAKLNPGYVPITDAILKLT